jgi:NAD(P)-dependent dehydrogenase (short-subunit alcohol dehydrogenase family)
MDFEGKGVVVTGASRGLGAALATKLAAEGARVVLVARAEEALEAVAARIRARGGEAYAVAGDVGDAGATVRLAGTASALAGPIDVLVHNASTLGPDALVPLFDTEPDDFVRTLHVNLVGPFRLTRALAGSMVLRGAGLVVHVSSDAAVSAYPRWGAYGVSKAALDHLNRIWAAELEGTGVTFLSVDPGEMDTAMHAQAVPDADRTLLADPTRVAEQVLGRMRTASELASGSRVVIEASPPVETRTGGSA